MIINSILSFFDKLTFSYKTTGLIFIIAGGMISIILLSQISIYALKNDFDVLFEKRTKPIIKLEKIKDTYQVNIFDTFFDIEQKYINIEEADDVIILGQQLINKNWALYKYNLFNNFYETSLVSELIHEFFFIESKDDQNDIIIRRNIIENIDKKINSIDKKIERITDLLKEKKNIIAFNEIKQMYFEINSVRIYISNLTKYDLGKAIDEKRDTQKVFNSLAKILNFAIIFVFLFSIILSILLINNFKKLHFSLEEAVNEKTKELQKLNDYLETRIKNEVANSRKKDLIMFQQSKLASLGEMLQNIAHQWRQPLGSLMMIIQAFQTKMQLGKLSNEFIDAKVKDAMKLGENMSNTLDDFQNFFDPNKHKSIFFVKDCIEHSLELSKYLLVKEKITYELIIKDDLEIYGYYNELSHVILNIVSNSKDVLKNKQNNKIIKIVIKEHNNNVRIHFYDNGGGIEEEILPKIFDPYYTTKYKSAGTGIGLYMSKQIIEKHMQGNIKCKNIYYKIDKENFENCALFIIDIPIEKKVKNAE